MQDRGFSPYTQAVFTEEPSLAEHFDGFVFYKNTISMGQFTMLGTPGIFGGYSYTPYEINKDTSKTLRQKHNESLLSLPLLFSENGYTATVADMPYENYLKQPMNRCFYKLQTMFQSMKSQIMEQVFCHMINNIMFKLEYSDATHVFLIILRRTEYMTTRGASSYQITGLILRLETLTTRLAFRHLKKNLFLLLCFLKISTLTALTESISERI